MATKDQVVEQIRFALSHLKTRNGHHELEELSRYLARQTIMPNILPATGPVAAAGDQGRDFETFRTFVTENLGSGFVGIVDTRAVAFLCTLQADDIVRKIQDDVAKIASTGTSVDQVYAFVEADVPIGIRHSLQSDVLRDHDIDLEVIDGTALAELLAEPNEFWIAERFLNVPAEIYPERDNPEEWYGDALQRWHQQESFAPTHGLFMELKSAVRYATREKRIADVHFWIEKLAQFSASEYVTERLRRAADYEVFVAQLIGLGSLVGEEDHLRDFFKGLEALDDPTDLSDTAVLLMFALGAQQRGLVHLIPTELRDLNRRADARASEMLREDRSRGEQAILLHVQGFLAVQPDLTRDRPEPMDIDAAIARWLDAAGLAKETPVFPVRVLADQIAVIAPLIASHRRYRELVDTVDELVADRNGQAAAGEKCRDRAMALYEADQLLAALHELHQAKIDWFGGDTLRGSILAMLFIGRIYASLGLTLAAKYHFLAAAYAAANAGDSSLLDLVPAGLLGAADADYTRGAWRSYLRLIRIGLRAFFEFGDEPDPYSSEEIDRAIFHFTLLRAISEIHRPDAIAAIEEIINEVGLQEPVAELLPTARGQWEAQSEDAFVENARRDLLGRPFSDVGDEVVIRWKALGVEWTVEYHNDCETEKVAERLAAMLQILHADLASRDVAILPTSVVIRVRSSAGEEADARFVYGDGKEYCDVELPRAASSLDVAAMSVKVLAVGMVLLLRVSVLPQDELRSLIEESFRGGISHKIAPASIYDILVEAFTPCEKDLVELRQLEPIGADTPFSPSEAPELRWRDGPGPKYSKHEAEEMIRNRYRKFPEMMRATLPVLSRDPGFLSIVERLRAEAWPDWQILSAVANLVFNTQNDVRSFSPDDVERMRREGPPQENPEDSPLPVTLFTYGQLQLMRRISAGSVLTNWGLELRPGMTDIEALLRLLTERYGFMSDDVDHDDLFDPRK